MSGVNTYRHQRQQEICEKGTFQDGSCFHDGEKVLKSVEDMHYRLRKRGEIHPKDHVTRLVLEQMVVSMLEEDPDVRPDAIWLWKKSQKLLTEARWELKESNQQMNPRKVDSMVNTQFYGLNISQTPPSDSVGQEQGQESISNGTSHSYGSPPNYPQYGFNLQIPVQSSSAEQTQKRRSDTWHEHSTSLDIAPGLMHGIASPPMPARQSLRTSPSPDIFCTIPEQAELRRAVSDETAIKHGEDTWQNIDTLGHNSFNSSRDVDALKYKSVLPHNIRDSSRPGRESNIGDNLMQHMKRDVRPYLPTFGNGGTFKPPLWSDPQRSKAANTSTADPMLQEASHRLPPEMQHVPPRSNTTATELSIQKAKPKIPRLSFERARQIRERHEALPHDIQDSLVDLKDRDHVSSLS